MAEVEVPKAFRFLYEPGHHRYRGAYGGRGSGKSHAFAQAIIIKARFTKNLRVCCVRETQESITESVKKLLDDKIEAMGLGDFFRSLAQEIRGKNGSQIIFAGIQSDPRKIKSMERIDICWVEEAASLSKASIEFLTPTIRAHNSEIWVTWNPEEDDDPIEELLRPRDERGNPEPLPPGWLVRQVNWFDNPWFPDVLREEMERDRRRDADKYQHVWLGEYRQNSEARVFKNWRLATPEELVGPDGQPTGRLTPPTGVRVYYGADWGFGDPTVLVRGWLDEKARKLFICDEAYQVGCEIDNIPALFETVPDAKRWPIVGDNSRPETISYLKNRSWKITPSVKGPGSVEDGIEFLKSYDIVVDPRCIHTERELTKYSFKVDKKTQAVLPILEDKNNHVIDALRYALEGARKTVSHRAYVPIMGR